MRLVVGCCAAGEDHRRQSADEPCNQGCGWSIDQIQQKDDSETSERRAEKVDTVDLSGRKRAAGEGETDDDAGKDVRDRHGDEKKTPGEDRTEGEGDSGHDAELKDDRCGDGDRRGDGEVSERDGQRSRGQAIAMEVGPDGTHRHAQHGDADGEKGQIVPGHHRENASLDALKDEHREGQEKDAE